MRLTGVYLRLCISDDEHDKVFISLLEIRVRRHYATHFCEFKDSFPFFVLDSMIAMKIMRIITNYVDMPLQISCKAFVLKIVLI